MQSLKKNVLLGLTYLISIIFPLIVIFTYKDPDPDEDTRYHVIQAITLHTISFSLYLVAGILAFFVPVVPAILRTAGYLINVCTFVFAIMAFCDKYIKLDFLKPLTDVVNNIFYSKYNQL